MKGNIFILTFIWFFLSHLILTAQEKHTMHQTPMIDHAVALISPTKGNSVHGTITFQKNIEGVNIIINLAGLTPGKHGFHIHEFGDITSDDGNSAGGHFNPTAMPHGNPTSLQHHGGDLRNVVADEKGSAYLEYTDPTIELNGKHSIIGRSVVVHEKEDDYITQPTGNSGARIGVGVIGIAK
jgi:superoxide dismutase, Cu-Zn family